MAARIKWGERRFDFNFPVDLYPEMIERLRGTPARVEDRIRSLPAEALTHKEGEFWSIQEHAGHLLDLESLITVRLDNYDAGAEVLHAADMTNRKTFDANHNDKSIESILGAFRRERMKIIERLEAMEPSYFGRSALHPRLNKPMRVVDMLFFNAEHDDYHLARMTDLARPLLKSRM